jgi:hypothetical protein
VQPSLDGLLGVQRELRSRFDDFRRALDRRDEAAYRFAILDFDGCLRRWTQAAERAVLPAILRSGAGGRDPARELRLEWVQIRELTRFLREQIDARAPLSDVLGLGENLDRRIAAHERGMEAVYYPAAARNLTEPEWRILSEAAPAR